MARAYTGIFLPGNDGHALWAAGWDSFEAKWKELSRQGLRLVSVSAAMMGGSPQYAGAFRAGGGGHALWASPWESFEAKWKELSAQGLRLVSVDTFAQGRTRMWVGAYLPMHLRDGADHDADAAWNETMTATGIKAADLAEYKTHLLDTGNTKDPATRNLDAAHWGTNAETIPVSVGQQVSRGQQIAWAGNTGPGGKKGSGGPNTHLHIFWTRRDTDGQFYFYDPYGVYSTPDNYAAGVTDATSGPCVRYPVGWKGGKPQYP